jgi:hypothetical protein
MIPMKQIQAAILEMDGGLSREEFSSLCYAIHEMQIYSPNFPQMKEICFNVKVKAHKVSAGAVLKCLERATQHIFEHGDRAVLGTYQRSWLYEQPFPNQFIRTVAIRLLDEQAPPSSREADPYHLLS